MARTEAIRTVQAIYEHVDAHVRELLPPPPGAEVDSPLMILQGALSGAATFGGTSTASGSGACPAVPEFGGTIVNSFSGPEFKIATVPAPHGWTKAQLVRKRAVDGFGGGSYIGILFQDATMTDLWYTLGMNEQSLAEGETKTDMDMVPPEGQTSDAVRFMSVYARPTGTGPEGTLIPRGTTASASATFEGVCEDIAIPPSAGIISTGVAGVWSFDFKARITGWYLQEFEGTTGSIMLALDKAARGPAPTFMNIAGSAPPVIAGGRYGEDATLAGWTDVIDRGDVIRVSVSSVASFTRLLFGLRIRRLEP